MDDKIILKACKEFSDIQNLKKPNWSKVKNNIYICKLDKTNIGFLDLIVRWPKFECKVEDNKFIFYLLWKFKGIKKLQSKVLGTMNYNNEKNIFSKFKPE